jgi:hypothetical protein
MKTLKIYHRLIWGCAYTQNEVSNAILNLFIALAENDEQSIRSIIELYEITHTELLQIHELTGKAIRKVVPTFDEVLEMREDTPAKAEVEYTEEQVKILEHYYFINQLRQMDYDLEF